MVSRLHEQRHRCARNKTKLRENKAKAQPTSRAMPDRGSVRMNDNIWPAQYSTLTSLAKSVFKSTAFVATHFLFSG